MSGVFLFLAAFLASAVEGVEALTIVLAVGVARGWRSTLFGVAAASAALTAVVVVLGPALTVIPIRGLRVVVGGLLLVFGLQWLRKAILRASGFKALHDEEAIYRREAAQAAAAGDTTRASMDWYSFTVAFKGVLLEGLEVAFIVVTFGSNQGNIPLAAAGAVAAIVVVAIVGLRVRAPLGRVPENTHEVRGGTAADNVRHVLGGRGCGRLVAGKRPGAACPARLLRRGVLDHGQAAHGQAHGALPGRGTRGGRRMSAFASFGRFLYDFVIGDDWTTAVGVVIAVGLAALLVHAGWAGWWLPPLVVVASLSLSLWRGTRGIDSK